MKYMMLIYLDEKVLNEDERSACYEESVQLTHDLNAEGTYLDAAPLHPVSTAKTVRERDGKRLVTSGPFAETHEQLGGYFVVDARDEEHAIEIAGRIPGSKFGSVEVRPIIELPGMPNE
jgi:hypothetical protein